jgi:hypothetical protein
LSKAQKGFFNDYINDDSFRPTVAWIDIPSNFKKIRINVIICVVETSITPVENSGALLS